ncbi:ribonuclease H-like domain-containing protein [Tanacetum coccineum]
MTGWAEAKQNSSSGISLSRESDTHTLLVKLIDQLEALGITGSNTLSPNTLTSPHVASTTLAQYTTHVVSHTSQSPPRLYPIVTTGTSFPPTGFVHQPAQPSTLYHAAGPLGYIHHPVQPVLQMGQPSPVIQQAQSKSLSGPAAQPCNTGLTSLLSQATTLPHAFNAVTLHDLTYGAWNMDTVLLRCDSTRDLYPVTAPSPILHVFVVSQHTWHQRLGHPGGEVLRRLVSSNFISYNKEKPPVLCHACQLGKHVRLPFVSSSTVISSCFDIIHSDVWTSPILSLSEAEYHGVANVVAET